MTMFAAIIFYKNTKIFKIVAYSHDEGDCLHKMQMRAGKEPYEFLILRITEEGMLELRQWLDGFMFKIDKTLGIMSGISDAIKLHLGGDKSAS